MRNSWLLFVYKVPNEPTSRRVYVWRKMKRLGAILFNDVVWCLPYTEWTKEQFQWLASEIQVMEGTATVFESTMISTDHAEALLHQFIEQVDVEYNEIISELDRTEDPNLSELSKKYQQTLKKDYFHSELGNVVRQKLKEGSEKQ